MKSTSSSTRDTTTSSTIGVKHNPAGNNNTTSKVIIPLWDPCSSVTMLVPNTISTTTSSSSSRNNNNTMWMLPMKGIYCSTGISCNLYETKALFEILEDREEFQSWVIQVAEQNTTSMDTTTTTTTSEDNGSVIRKLRLLSQSYRKAIQNCLVIDTATDMTNDKEGSISSTTNTTTNAASAASANELLKCMSAVMHLSEIFLLPYPTTATTTPPGTDEGDTIPISLPGSLTANTVRYLRAHHLPSKWHVLNNMNNNDDKDNNYDEVTLLNFLEEMLSSDQPEHWSKKRKDTLSIFSDDTTTTTTTTTTTNNDFSIYWKLVRSLVIRGCLKDAWNILSHHSYTTTYPEGFIYLRAILLSAPIPGGRRDTMDDGFPSKTEEEENEDFPRMTQDEEEEEASSLTNIPSNAYEGWGSTRTSSKSEPSTSNNHTIYYSTTDNNDGAGTAAGIRTAKSYYTMWSNLITTSTTSDGPLNILLQRIPELRWAVFDVISGRASYSSTFTFDGWAEALCAELLYLHPMIRPEDIPIRAKATMDTYTTEHEEEEEEKNFINELVLSIMKKDAGSAVEALHKFGGGSSAALPSTLTALFCDLLVLAGCTPKTIVATTANTNYKINDYSSHDSKQSIVLDLRKELFLTAAWACEACFHAMDDQDDEVGIRCAARLLLLEGSVQSRCALYDILGRRIPSSDAEAKSWLAIVSSTSSSLHIGDDLSDIGSSIALSRARYYLAQSRPGGAAYWMLRGAEVESIRRRQPEKYATAASSSRGIATIKLGALCIQTASDLLKSLTTTTTTTTIAKAAPVVAKNMFVASEIINSIGEDDAISTSLDGISMSAFSLLCNVSDLATALLQENYAEAGFKISSCLVDRPTDGTTMLPLAHPTFWFDFLYLAFNILKIEEHHISKEISMEQQDPSFDVNGIHILMARLKLLESSEHADALFPKQQEKGGLLQRNTSLANDVNEGAMIWQQIDGSVSDMSFSLPEMRLLLARGLMRAFLSDNSKRKTAVEAEMEWKFKEESAFHAPPLLGGLEESIELLLGPPPCSI